MSQPHDVTYAIGDIHGQAALLRSLQATIVADARRIGAKAPRVVYLGDYVDRGPDSRGAIDLTLDGLPGFQKLCLRGNHEELMLGFLRDPLGEDAMNWLRNGGLETLTSYGIEHTGFFDIAGRALEVRSALASALAPRHFEHLDNLPRISIEGEAIFVHAGLNPDYELDEQDERDLVWIRAHFHDSDRNWGRPVVHGHTPACFGPEVLENRINLDTGAFFTGFLTAAVLRPSESPRFLVGARRRSHHVLVDPKGDAPAHWLDWALDAAASAGAKAVGLCLADGARAAEGCLKRGLRARPVKLEKLVEASADPESPLSKSIEDGKTTICFGAKVARRYFNLAVEDVKGAAARAARNTP